MLCKVDGCGRTVRYKTLCLCQMHYFRLRRNGDLESHRPVAKPRIEDDRGYQFLHMPKHPLLTKGQIYVAEQRVVLYEAIGPGPMTCELCGCGLTWKTCQADHIDENPRNNERSNIRPLCRRCNVWRSMPPAHIRMKNATALTYMGETKTAFEWSKDPRVNVTATTIRHRKKAGMSDEQALFADKVTHNGRLSVDKRPRKTRHKHERANAVAITVNGVTKTAAEWARDPAVSVSAAGIVWRIRKGWAPDKAVLHRGRFASDEMLRPLPEEVAV